jgi:putative FmdB family regulatory protein
MPLYDLECSPCKRLFIDQWAKVDETEKPCPDCGQPTQRVWIQGHSSAVIGDDIPGGIEIRHGLCNPDGTPKKYYTKSEIAREAKARGLQPHVEHVTAPGTDKNPHTTRWV